MRTFILALATAFLFLGCGTHGSDGLTSDTGTPGGASPPNSSPPALEDPVTPPADSIDPPVVVEPPQAEPELTECMLKTLDEDYGKECQKLIYNGEVIAGPELGEKRITLYASRVLGEKKIERNFDVGVDLKEPVNLALPERIEVRGEGVRGEVVYVRINAYTDCAWFSQKDGAIYGDPVCYEAAERAPSSHDGFKGGIEVDHVRAKEVTRLEMTITGAAPGKRSELTTAIAVFDYD